MGLQMFLSATLLQITNVTTPHKGCLWALRSPSHFLTAPSQAPPEDPSWLTGSPIASAELSKDTVLFQGSTKKLACL